MNWKETAILSIIQCFESYEFSLFYWLGKRDTAAAGGAPDIQISRLHVTSDIQLRYARTLVTSYIKNAGKSQASQSLR